MRSVVVSLLMTVRVSLRERAALQLEILALRHQLHVVNRSRPQRLRLTPADRMLWVWLSNVWNGWRAAVVIVKPETVLAWHRRGFRLLWTWKSRRRLGSTGSPSGCPSLIRTMAEANPLWGAPRIHGELLKLGIDVSQATVAKYMPRHRRPPSQNWRTFLANHVDQIMAPTSSSCRPSRIDCCSCWSSSPIGVVASSHVAVTAHPTALWTAQQLREAFPEDAAPRYLIHDRDHAFAALAAHGEWHGHPGAPHGPSFPVAERVRGAGHRLHPTRVSRSRDRPE